MKRLMMYAAVLLAAAAAASDDLKNWEKIRLLREDGAISPELQSAMNELDWDAVNADSADVTRRKVEAVQNLLNR